MPDIVPLTGPVELIDGILTLRIKDNRFTTISGTRAPAGVSPVTFETGAVRRAVRVRDAEE
jgi:hypothetical protein